MDITYSWTDTLTRPNDLLELAEVKKLLREIAALRPSLSFDGHVDVSSETWDLPPPDTLLVMCVNRDGTPYDGRSDLALRIKRFHLLRTSVPPSLSEAQQRDAGVFLSELKLHSHCIVLPWWKRVLRWPAPSSGRHHDEGSGADAASLSSGAPRTPWDEVKQKYGPFIKGNPVDDQTFPRVRLHTFYRDQGHADAVLGRIADDAAAVLRPTNEGISRESGAPKYHVVHEGSLTGKQIKDYLITVVAGGGEIWEVFL